MSGSEAEGVVTFLFTDVEGSTKLWQADRARMASALEHHDQVIAQAVEGHGGEVFKHTGDGMCAVFATPGEALGAARVAQAQVGLPVRMAIHTGEAQRRDGDYFGPTLNRCARLMDAGHGGQILVSEVAQAMLETAELVDLGEQQLKDLAQPERVFQFGSGTFPALRVAHRPRSLPVVLTSLVGRDGLVAQLSELLATERLVTLVGPGGVGKTRLAVRAAEAVAERYDQVVFVDLATVGDGAEVLPAIARAMELTRQMWEAVAIALEGRRLLLVLDNCEQVVDAVADMVMKIIEHSPGAVVLATSREGLAIDGERLIAVPGLSSDGAGSGAVALFADRAAAADPSFELDEDAAIAASELCRRLDGLPLAIELAAARLSQMSIDELTVRIDDRFEVLTGGRRRRSRDRHRTLRETIDWSHDLLDPEEQKVFANLSVFASSFDLAGARSVLPDHEETDVLDLLGALVDKSMLTTTRVGDRVRYRYLETVRAYAEERLDLSGRTDATFTLLAKHLADVVDSAVDEIFGSSLVQGAARLRVEIPNMRRCVDHAIACGDITAAAALITPMAAVGGTIDWHITGWATEILALPGARDHPARPSLMMLEVTDAWLAGRFRRLPEMCRAALTAAGAPPGSDSPAPWWMHMAAGLNTAIGGDDRFALDQGERAIAAASELDADLGLHARIWVDAYYDAVDGWERRCSLEEVELARQHDSELIRHRAHLWLATHFLAQRDFSPALEDARAAADTGVEGAGTWFAALQMQAIASLGLGDLTEALDIADVDLHHARRLGDRSAMFIPVAVYALAMQQLGDAEAAATIRGWLPNRLTIMLSEDIVALDDWLEARLSPDQIEDLRLAGRQLSPEDIQALGRAIASA